MEGVKVARFLDSTGNRKLQRKRPLSEKALERSGGGRGEVPQQNKLPWTSAKACTHKHRISPTADALHDRTSDIIQYAFF